MSSRIQGPDITGTIPVKSYRFWFWPFAKDRFEPRRDIRKHLFSWGVKRFFYLKNMCIIISYQWACHCREPLFLTLKYILRSGISDTHLKRAKYSLLPCCKPLPFNYLRICRVSSYDVILCQMFSILQSIPAEAYCVDRICGATFHLESDNFSW